MWIEGVGLEHEGEDADVEEDYVKVVTDESCSKTANNDVRRDDCWQDPISCPDVHASQR